MNELDLNIDNYDLNDLLNLFKMPYDFDKDDMKQAKKIVLKTHPDKSGLDKEYFLFFTSAYKILLSIYEFRYKSNNKSTTYHIEKNEENEELLKNIKNKKDFNKWFNELFEKTQIKKENDGYGNWLESDENIDNIKVSKNEMNEAFENKKESLKNIIIHNGISELGSSNNHYEVTGNNPDEYSSDIFSKFGYEDLRKAHTESVVPVNNSDYNNIKKFRNLQEMNDYRNSQSLNPQSVEQSRTFLKDKEQKQHINDVERAYKLAKQDEKNKEMNQKWWSQLKQLKM